MDAGSSGFIGRMVAGRYRILAKLGEGGMGSVYRAEQISLKRTVALKLLRPELSAEPGMVRRFNAEAELAAKLSHPNTVTLFDFGQDEDGSLFIAMEYLEGRSLREVLTREGPLSPGRALTISEQLCASLADAHSRGIVHRDLKPDNVMLIQRGRMTDVARVLDFGIAKLRDEQSDGANRPMTRAGDLLGTPQYMAPEQIRGETVDARTDIYALGAMLYEMVTGRLPFEGPTLMSILSKHLTEMPVPPRERRPDLRISPSLNQLVMDALDKDPARRPASMDAFADRLARLVVEVDPRSEARAAAGAGFPPPPALPDSPPPGVPLLRTPLPGALQAPPPPQARAGSSPPVGYPSPPPPMAPQPGSHGGEAPHGGAAYAGQAAFPAPAAGSFPSPAPGSFASPAPGPFASPAPGSFASPAPGTFPSPAPGSFPSPAPGPFQSPAPGAFPGQPRHRAASSVPAPVRASTTGHPGGGRAGMWIALGLVVAGAAGVAVYFAARPDNQPPLSIASDAPAAGHPPAGGGDPGASGGSGAVNPDFSVKPERELYGGGGTGGGGTGGGATTDPTGATGEPSHGEPGQAQDGVWQGGWWKDASGALELDIPKGFTVGAAGGAAMFAGHCGDTRCTINTVTTSTWGVQMDDAMMAQVVGQLPMAAGHVGDVSPVRIQGRDRYSVIIDSTSDGTRAQVVMFAGSGTLSVVIIQAPGAAFDRTADFRKTFFERHVRVR
jgi:serine/threonine protein kinase